MWRPPYCKSCNKVGYDYEVRPKKEKKWVLKGSRTTPTKEQKETKRAEVTHEAEIPNQMDILNTVSMENPVWIMIGPSRNMGKTLIGEDQNPNKGNEVMIGFSSEFEILREEEENH